MTEVIVFCREPRAGEVKTRLARSIGARAAVELYRTLLDHTVAVAVTSGYEVRLSLASDPLEAPTREHPWEVQPSGDLGHRLRGSFERAFERGVHHVVIVGSDSPEVTPNHVRQAADALHNADVVLGRATDGGYWLVGQRDPGADLFRDIPWSVDSTLERTLERARRLDLEVCELEELIDLDTVEDLVEALSRGRMTPRVEQAVRRALSAETGR